MNTTHKESGCKAVNYIISSAWTIEYKFLGNQIEIVKYSRDDPEGYEHNLPKGKLIETDNRTVIGAIIDGTHYSVTNPRHIFDYTGE